ncbi:MAG: DUF3311 domain-containing protein [Nitrososphaerales archaeon]
MFNKKGSFCAENVQNNSSVKIVLALLLAVPIAINAYLPIYNRVNPELGGLPFFWWFQMFMLAICVVPYLAFSFIENARTKNAIPISENSV